MSLSQNFLLYLYLSVSALISGSVAFAQHSVPAPRIVEQIDESQLVTLKGNTLPVANSQNDRGPVSPALRMTDLVLVLSRSPEQQADFDAFVASQYDPSSPNFHHWLASADIAETYGPSAADIAVISNWLAGHGFLIDEIAKDRMSIRFSGAAAQVESAFHTAIDNLSVNGEMHIANMSDPQIPAALASVVAGVKALHNFFPRPLHRLGGLAIYNRETGRWQRAADATTPGALLAGASGADPEFGYTTNGYTLEDVAPYDFATIYNVLPLWNANIDGAGQTIAVAGTSDIISSDVTRFRSVFGLPPGTPPQTIVANGTDPGVCLSSDPNAPCTFNDLVENTLDVEWSGAVAKGAAIVLVVSGSNSATTDTVYSSANYVVQNSTANILNVSYGMCELGMGTGGNAAYKNLWETAATEGIAVFVASGDAGSAGCDQGLAANPPHEADYGLSVSGVASTPYNTAVGGTDFNWGTTAAPYWATTDSASNDSNALGYIPEVPWNDTCTNPLALNYFQEWAQALLKAGYSATSPTDAESACNFVLLWWQTIYDHTSPAENISVFLDTVGGGGGASNCTISNGSTVASCAGGYAKPGWQTGVTGIPEDEARDLPDVSFFAGNGFLGSAYLICVSAEAACSYSSSYEPEGEEVGGTSAASPAMAGVMALINQKAGAPQGNPNAELYALAGRQGYSNCSAESANTNDGCYFNDPDTGTNAMVCASGAPNCTLIHSGDSIGVLPGYSAGTGYDAATGLGSLNVANVVNAWISTMGTATATVTVTPAQTSFPLTQSLRVLVTVSGSNGTPAGTVVLTGGGYTAPVETLSGGSYTFTIPGDALSAGADTLKASYSGNATYAVASGTASVTVTKLTPTVTVQANPSSIGANTTVNVTITVTGSGPTPTGTVQLTGGGYFAGGCMLVTGTCSIAIAANTLSNGTDILTANYSGDSDYTSESGTATETVNALTPTVTVTPSLTSLNTATTLQVTVAVAGTGPTPTGVVDLCCGYTTGQFSGSLSGGSYTFTLPSGTLAGGTDMLTAVYEGDSNYLSETAATTVTVSKINPAITVNLSSASMYSNASLTVTGTVTGAGAEPTGTVMIASGSYFEGVYILANSGNSYYLAIPPGSLSVGADTVTVTYNGDPFYNTASTSASVTVTQFVKIAPTVTVTSTTSTLSTEEALSGTATVSGADGTPTGAVTFSWSGNSSSPAQLYQGVANFLIPANSLSVGSYTITASYNGDSTYLPATGTENFTVTQSVYGLTASTPVAISPGESTGSTITVSSSTGYTGVVTLSCALESSPAGASNLPACSVVSRSSTVTLTSGATSGTGAVSVTTTEATSGALMWPALHGRGSGWAGAGETLLALLIFLGIPARRRGWRSMLGVPVLLAVFAGLELAAEAGAVAAVAAEEETAAPLRARIPLRSREPEIPR